MRYPRPPVIVNRALAVPAGSEAIGDGAFAEIFHPVARRLARCDAVLRVGGASAGADEMVATAGALGPRVFHGLADVPDAG